MGKKPKVYDPLAAARTSPAKIQSLALNPAAARNAGLGLFEPFAKFPPEILACTNLVELEIFRGLAWNATIPKEIGSLAKLTSLSLGGLGMRALPDELGKLVALESLDLCYASQLKALPKTIGKLTRLARLNLSYCEALAALPESIGALRHLRELSAPRTKLKTVPAALWKLTALERLALPDAIGKLPPGIGKLTKLRELALSGAALASIAGELGQLRALRLLTVNGAATTLPDLSGTSLVELHAGFLGLTSLPALPASLETLYVSGNQLASLAPVVRGLGKLTSLDFSDNQLGKAEKRDIDRLMKLPPKRRAAAVAPAASVPIDKPVALGKIASINASLSMIVADGKVAAAWRGVDGDDFERACDALAARDLAPIDIAGSRAIALSLEVGQGIAHAYRVGDRVVLVEGFVDDPKDELYLEWLASAPAKARPAATLDVPSQRVVAMSITDTADDGLAIPLAATRVAIVMEPEAKGSWGHARRCHLVPS